MFFLWVAVLFKRTCTIMPTKVIIILGHQCTRFLWILLMMQEASKRRCNKIKLLSLSFVSKLISQKILIDFQIIGFTERNR